MTFFSLSVRDAGASRVLLTIALAVTACGDANDADRGAPEPAPKEFTAQQLQLLHNGGEKVWRVVQIYERYQDEWDHSRRTPDEDLTACTRDDSYVFTVNEDIEIRLGMTPCLMFLGAQAQEAATANYFYHAKTRHVVMEHSRGETLEQVAHGELFVVGLLELSAERALFVAGDEPPYGRAIEFEAVP